MNRKTEKSIQNTKRIVYTKKALDLDKKMRMEVNMSDYIIRGVLSMKCKNIR